MRVLAINDVSCVGKCSLTVTLPILSACGVECNVLPTAILSTHTGGFEGYTFRDLTEDIPAVLKHWKSLGLTFDYIYSGYLGSIAQIDLVMQIAREFLARSGKLIVDPVMGDNGRLYDGFSKEYVEKMRSLCRLADYILPNETEACYLTDFSYPLQENATAALKALAKLCPHPVLTGLSDGKRMSIYYMDEGKAKVVSHENVHGFFCGAGDVFTSAFVGCLANGVDEERAIELSSAFVSDCIHRSAKEVEDKRFGLPFEKEIYTFLKNLYSLS